MHRIPALVLASFALVGALAAPAAADGPADALTSATTSLPDPFKPSPESCGNSGFVTSISEHLKEEAGLGPAQGHCGGGGGTFDAPPAGNYGQSGSTF